MSKVLRAKPRPSILTSNREYIVDWLFNWLQGACRAENSSECLSALPEGDTSLPLPSSVCLPEAASTCVSQRLLLCCHIYFLAFSVYCSVSSFLVPSLSCCIFLFSLFSCLIHCPSLVTRTVLCVDLLFLRIVLSCTGALCSNSCWNLLPHLLHFLPVPFTLLFFSCPLILWHLSLWPTVLFPSSSQLHALCLVCSLLQTLHLCPPTCPLEPFLL